MRVFLRMWRSRSFSMVKLANKMNQLSAIDYLKQEKMESSLDYAMHACDRPHKVKFNDRSWWNISYFFLSFVVAPTVVWANTNSRSIRRCSPYVLAIVPPEFNRLQRRNASHAHVSDSTLLRASSLCSLFSTIVVHQTTDDEWRCKIKRLNICKYIRFGFLLIFLI